MSKEKAIQLVSFQGEQAWLNEAMEYYMIRNGLSRFNGQ